MPTQSMHYFKLCLESVSSRKLCLECCVLEKTTDKTASIVLCDGFLIVVEARMVKEESNKPIGSAIYGSLCC